MFSDMTQEENNGWAVERDDMKLSGIEVNTRHFRLSSWDIPFNRAF